MASSAFIAVAAAGVGLAPTVGLIIPALLLYGLGDGIAISAIQDLAAGAAPAAQRGAVIAVWVMCVRIGQFLGPLTASAIYAASSTTVAMVLGAVLFGVLALFLTVAPIYSETESVSQ